jgi:hypothetical protein
MPEINPLAVIAECIEKAKATTDPEVISDYIAEALGVLQIDNTEDDAFHMLGSAIVDAVKRACTATDREKFRDALADTKLEALGGRRFS